MDLSFINTIIDYLDYAAWLAVILGVIISAVLFALGKLREGSKKFIYVMIGAFVLAFGFTIVQDAIAPVPAVYAAIPGYQYIGYIAYAGAAVSIIASAILLVKGDLREAGTYFIAAILIIWAVNYAPSLFSSSTPTSSQFGTIVLSANPSSGNAPLTFTLQGLVISSINQSERVDIYAVNTSNGYIVNLTPAVVNSNGEFSVQETINQPGQWEIIAYIPNTSIQGSTAVYVEPAPNFGWNFFAQALYEVEQFFEGLASGVIQIFNVPFAYAVMMPIFPTNGGDPFGIGQTIYQMYQYSEGVAFGILGIFLVGNILYRLWNNEAEEGISRIIISVSKDVITVAFVIVAAPYLYDTFANIVNEVGGALLNYGNPGILLGEAIAVIASGMGLGYFVPELANLGADLAFSVFLAFALFVIRFLAIAAILVATPILAAFWLFPPFRGAVRLFFDMILALGISGIIAAALFALLGKLASNTILAVPIGLASPVLFGFLPMLLSFTGVSGIMTQGGFFPFRRGKGAQTGQSSGQTQSGGQTTTTPTPAGTTNQSGTVGQTKLRSPKLSQQYGTPSSIQIDSPRPAPVGIIERIKNRETAKITTSAENPINVPRGYSIVKAREYTDYGPVQTTPPSNLRITANDMANMKAISSLSMEKQGNVTVFSGTATNLRKKDVEIKETKTHAFIHGIGENLKAGGIMFAQKLGQRFDNWLNAQGVSIRPFEAIENKIYESRLRKSGKKRTQTT